ncbi:MAG TPA: transcriptional regulator [Lachnospiraceae bacterium]|nr:transcriptional regulator [Lachnospiraceae bacterium]
MELVRVEIIMNEVKMETLKEALRKYHVTGMTVFKAQGCGVQYGTPEYEDEDTSEIRLLDKTVVMLVMPKENAEDIVQRIMKDLYTGHIGDGKIFISQVENAYRVRTGEDGEAALEPAAF